MLGLSPILLTRSSKQVWYNLCKEATRMSSGRNYTIVHLLSFAEKWCEILIFENPSYSKDEMTALRNMREMLNQAIVDDSLRNIHDEGLIPLFNLLSKTTAFQDEENYHDQFMQWLLDIRHLRERHRYDLDYFFANRDFVRSLMREPSMVDNVILLSRVDEKMTAVIDLLNEQSRYLF
jgi:hypothetical protein